MMQNKNQKKICKNLFQCFMIGVIHASSPRTLVTVPDTLLTLPACLSYFEALDWVPRVPPLFHLFDNLLYNLAFRLLLLKRDRIYSPQQARNSKASAWDHVKACSLAALTVTC